MQKKKMSLGKKLLIGLGVLTIIIGMIGSAFDDKKPSLNAAVKKETSLTKVQTDSISRQETIKKGFSGWDGSHLALEKLVKANMNDPKSYEHVETKYWDFWKDTLVVLMKYRGKNAFGGVVTETVKAHVNIDGTVIDTFE